jgi:hypothetical protein
MFVINFKTIFSRCVLDNKITENPDTAIIITALIWHTSAWEAVTKLTKNKEYMYSVLSV